MDPDARHRYIDDVLRRTNEDITAYRRSRGLGLTPIVLRDDPIRRPLWQYPRDEWARELKFKANMWQLKWSLATAELGMGVSTAGSIGLYRLTGSLWAFTLMAVVTVGCLAQMHKWYRRGQSKKGTWRAAQVAAAEAHLAEHDPDRPW